MIMFDFFLTKIFYEMILQNVFSRNFKSVMRKTEILHETSVDLDLKTIILISERKTNNVVVKLPFKNSPYLSLIINTVT